MIKMKHNSLEEIEEYLLERLRGIDKENRIPLLVSLKAQGMIREFQVVNEQNGQYKVWPYFSLYPVIYVRL